MTEQQPEAAWIVIAEWVNSSPTHHGPFAYLEQAELWARDRFETEDACVQYDFGILTPAGVAAVTL